MDKVFCQSIISIEPDVVVVGGSTIIKCYTTASLAKIHSVSLVQNAPSTKIGMWSLAKNFVLEDETDKKLIMTRVPTYSVNFTSVKCKDASGYTCSYQEIPSGKKHATSHLTVIDNPKSMTLQATSQCSGNDCSKCGTPAFTGTVLRQDEMTFKCSKKMAFHKNVTNYFKWFIYGSGGWVEEKKTTQLSTTNVNKGIKNGTCLTNEYSHGTMSYTAKKTDPERMKVKCVAEMHIYGKLEDSKEKLLDLCVLPGGTPTVDPLANRGNKNVGGVVVGVVVIAVGVRFY